METHESFMLHPPSQPPPLLPAAGAESRPDTSSRAAKRMGYIRPKPEAEYLLSESEASSEQKFVQSESRAKYQHTEPKAKYDTAVPMRSEQAPLMASDTMPIQMLRSDSMPIPAMSIPSMPTPSPVSVRSDSTAKSAKPLPKAPESVTPVKPTFYINPAPKSAAAAAATLGAAAAAVTPTPGATAARRSRSNTFHTQLDSILDTSNNNVDVEHKSGAYFRRLLILPETTPAATQFRLVDVSRKILFAFLELHSSLRRFTGFCVDKKLTMRMVAMLYLTKTEVDHLVECLESLEDGRVDSAVTDRILRATVSAIQAFRSVIGVLQTGLAAFVEATDACFIRMFILTVYGSYAEICNAYRLLNPAAGGGATGQARVVPAPATTSDADTRLYESLAHATASAQTVFTQLTESIGKSAIASATAPDAHQINSVAAAKIRELTNASVTAISITKKVSTRLETIRETSGPEKRRVWEDINLFLKAVINILATSRSAFHDLPVLNDIRPSMAALTKATKDVTLALEVSSYKSGATNPPPLLTVPSVVNMFSPNTSIGPSTPTTPMIAALGPAALAVLPAQSPGVYPNPFEGLKINSSQ
ncbi:hypothetical protein BABINDRAFT_160149 [Babjeviella inositovora NRRL Y-12698]|uniref:Uncharacterized protein n=1 Tax=Babjeviella inositovora NRRL Y-12698 TaxID=984486 RepID=A0A1E3QW86_9ASCO|nr:uncharacterized protein BABINDRAFT_160149 [Babjeviella inositovora NRRL Y-12698]ODQ81925.1 hypothetical protein BABINDRAFT_160149 [Babjeviella inositovora NRRL Y-12698]